MWVAADVSLVRWDGLAVSRLRGDLVVLLHGPVGPSDPAYRSVQRVLLVAALVSAGLIWLALGRVPFPKAAETPRRGSFAWSARRLARAVATAVLTIGILALALEGYRWAREQVLVRAIDPPLAVVVAEFGHGVETSACTVFSTPQLEPSAIRSRMAAPGLRSIELTSCRVVEVRRAPLADAVRQLSHCGFFGLPQRLDQVERLPDPSIAVVVLADEHVVWSYGRVVDRGFEPLLASRNHLMLTLIGAVDEPSSIFVQRSSC